MIKIKNLEIHKRLFILGSAAVTLSITAIAFAVMEGGGFSLLGKLLGMASYTQSSDARYSLEQTVGEPVGVTSMASKDGMYEISSTVNLGAASKLEPDLAKAHCYPNPYRPSRGHKKITFSRLTDHTRLMIFNIAGELIYETEEATPSGELVWNVVNKYGERIASGVYIYLISDAAGKKAKGKFAIIN